MSQQPRWDRAAAPGAVAVPARPAQQDTAAAGTDGELWAKLDGELCLSLCCFRVCTSLS